MKMRAPLAALLTAFALVACGANEPPVIEKLTAPATVARGSSGQYLVDARVDFSDDSAVSFFDVTAVKGEVTLTGSAPANETAKGTNFQVAFFVPLQAGRGPLLLTLVAVDDDDARSEPASVTVELE